LKQDEGVRGVYWQSGNEARCGFDHDSWQMIIISFQSEGQDGAVPDTDNPFAREKKN